MTVQDGPEPDVPSLECFRCGVCCTRHQAPVTADDARRISGFLRLPLAVFIDRFTDPKWTGQDKLLRHSDGHCPFLVYGQGGKINDCRIHPVKPAACLDWASGPARRECREGLDRYWQLSLNDAGQLQGEEEKICEFQSSVKSLEND